MYGTTKCSGSTGYITDRPLLEAKVGQLVCVEVVYLAWIVQNIDEKSFEVVYLA